MATGETTYEALVDEVTKEFHDNFNQVFRLKDEQKIAIFDLLRKKDVLAVLPTGFGKSLIYQYFVVAKAKQQNMSVECVCVSALIICPLSSIIEDQIKEAETLGITACRLKDVLTEKTLQPRQLMFASAEDVMLPTFRNLLKDSSALNDSLELLVVDESHTVETWTGMRDALKKKRKTKTSVKAFREAFGDLAVLRSLCKEGTPVLALTGTADKTTVKAIASSLSLKGWTDIYVSPDRQNIRISVFKCAKIRMLSHLDWLIKVIRDRGVEAPKTLIFCNTMNDIAAVSNYILLKLGNNAFHQADLKTAENCLIGIYHAATWDSQKDIIVKALKSTAQASVKRIVIATTALSMGVNFPDIRYIINWGPPRSLLDYHQEIGRAGRDGNQSDAITYFYGQQLSHCEDDVKSFMRSTTCYRVASLLPFDKQVQPLTPHHNCCSVCKNVCSCDMCVSCFAYDLPFESTPHSNVLDSPHAVRNVSKEDREDTRNALMELFSRVVNEGDESEVKFYTQLVGDIVKDCHKIFTVEDIINYPIFSMRRALKILEIFSELFDDISILPSFKELETIDDLLDLSQFASFRFDSSNASSSDSEFNGSDDSLP